MAPFYIITQHYSSDEYFLGVSLPEYVNDHIFLTKFISLILYKSMIT